MAFNPGNNNNFSNNNNNQSGEKKRSNFRVGRIYGLDGTIDVSIWNSDKGGTYGILSIKAAVGKDPSTGANVYEQKMSGELPAIFMNVELMRAFIDACKPQSPENINISIDTKRGSKMSIVGSGNTIKLTIDHAKNGSRTVTLEAVPVGQANIHSNFLNLIDMIEICFKKAITNKLDPDEFAMVIGGDDGESPF